MKIIFSRKGFDSQYGRVPSPILSDGSLQTLPIPSRYGRPLGDIQGPLGPLHNLASDLTVGAITPRTSVHLDPDLSDGSVARRPGWRASLGQVGSAQKHLAKQGVGPGDVFLFFEWFRQAEHFAGRWRYVPGAPNVHALFGWLQVGQVHKVGASECPAWLDDHPHVQHAARIGADNTIYVAGERLVGSSRRVAAAGAFRSWGPDLQLTAPGCSRSVWRVPRWLLKNPEQPILSYHRDSARWRIDGECAIVQTVGKGQEFVIDVGDCKDASQWLHSLVLRYGTSTGALA
ncbi:hypothetical protein NE850_19125 [Paraburkholderia sp. USG1]|uniref:Nmad3 family putative nucleotide modification protein n=1 Tax=Paraburkholderia sp. USG1 TaxID=2952268 RepID=UPI00285588A3|nr:hypothetical protein [Paraburkholderia sp. USG1]MDR8398456.1 hypothetical protein [Paraburkholderia sp. USG1]